MWADNETTRDLLDFRVHADLIRRNVTDPKILPVTVGLFGDWGGGKTSVMHMLREDLDPEKYPKGSAEHEAYSNIVCLYFNGWLFEGYDDAKAALLTSILEQLTNDKRFGKKVEDAAKSLLQSVDWMRLARFGFKDVAVPTILAYFSGGLSLLPALWDAGKKALQTSSDSENDKTFLNEAFRRPDNADVPKDVRTFRERFGAMLKDAGIQSLVVLIDDLDRCSPQRIIDNLEAIKLFLSVDNTAYVIGADRRIVRHAIATVYKSNDIQKTADQVEQATDVVDDYLEKLIQIPYWLPRLSPAEVETYMSLLFCERSLAGDALKNVWDASNKHRQDDKYRVFGYGSIQHAIGTTLADDLSASLHFCASSAPLITEGLKGNPRQIKRFLNAYVLRKQLAEVAKLTNIKDDVLVKLMVLEYAHLKQFNQLFSWQAAQDGVPKEIEQLELALTSDDISTAYDVAAKNVDPPWNTTSLRRWVEMSPSLRGVDLRDYFWVARDRLQSTLSQLTLVPPAIRRIFEDLISENSGRSSPALSSLKTASGDDVAQVNMLFLQHIRRDPSQKALFDGLFEMIELNIPGSVDVLVEGLMNCQADRINPAIGVRILTLLRKRTDLEAKLKPVVERLESSKTSVAGALASRVKN